MTIIEAFQCDRCFKFFTGKGLIDPTERTINTARCSYKHVKIIYGGSGADIGCMDLCPSCYKSLKHWAKNPYIDETKEGEAE